MPNSELLSISAAKTSAFKIYDFFILVNKKKHKHVSYIYNLAH